MCCSTSSSGQVDGLDSSFLSVEPAPGCACLIGLSRAGRRLRMSRALDPSSTLTKVGWPSVCLTLHEMTQRLANGAVCSSVSSYLGLGIGQTDARSWAEDRYLVKEACPLKDVDSGGLMENSRSILSSFFPNVSC